MAGPKGETAQVCSICGRLEMSRADVTLREVLLADMYEEQIDRLTAELERYKQGVEVEAIVCSGEEDDGSSNEFRWVMLPDEFKVGQRVRVLVLKEDEDE